MASSPDVTAPADHAQLNMFVGEHRAQDGDSNVDAGDVPELKIVTAAAASVPAAGEPAKESSQDKEPSSVRKPKGTPRTHGTKRFPTLVDIVRGVAAELGGRVLEKTAQHQDEGLPTTGPGGEDPVPEATVSFALLAEAPAVPARVPVTRVHDFLNRVGERAVEEGIPDVQFFLQERWAKNAKDTAIKLWGVVCDVDRVATDPLGEAQAAGIPVPTFHFRTARGFKLGFVFETATEMQVFEAFAQWVTLSIPGADPTSWLPGQGQRLPIVIKTVESKE